RGIIDRAITEHSRVAAPVEQCPVRPHREADAVANGDPGDPGQAGYLLRGTAGGGGAVPELAVLVAAPGPDGPVGTQRHAEVRAAGHLRHPGQAGYLRG